MSDNEIKSLLYTIYQAGFNHGINEKSCVLFEHSPFDAFNRLIAGESPTNDGTYYDIKSKIESLIKDNE